MAEFDVRNSPRVLAHPGMRSDARLRELFGRLILSHGKVELDGPLQGFPSFASPNSGDTGWWTGPPLSALHSQVLGLHSLSTRAK